MKESAKALLSKNKNELYAVRTLYVSLDRADNVIDGPAFTGEKVLRVPHLSRRATGGAFAFGSFTRPRDALRL